VNPDPRTLLAECASIGATLRPDRGRLVVECATTIPTDRVERLRTSRDAILAIMTTRAVPVSDAHAPDRAGIAGGRPDDGAIGRIEQLIAGWGDVRRCRGGRWSRDGAARIIRTVRWWGDRATAVAFRDSWRERVAIATIDGGLAVVAAERVATTEIERRFAEWSARPPRASDAGAVSKPRPLVLKPPIAGREGVSVPVLAVPRSVECAPRDQAREATWQA